MTYMYNCKNSKCSVDTVSVNKPMKDSSKDEYCDKCKILLTRNYNTGMSIKTGDGLKI